MASVVSLRPPAPPPPPARRTASPAHAKVILQCRAQPIPPSEHNALSDERTHFGFGERSGTRRREALFQIFLSAASFPFVANNASAEIDLQQSFRMYEDETNKFRISIPQDWLVGAGEANGIKSITAFYPEGTSDSNVSVVITGLGPDFTRLESFGTVDAFAESLVNGLDRSWKSPPGLAAKLINSKAANEKIWSIETFDFPSGQVCIMLSTRCNFLGRNAGTYCQPLEWHPMVGTIDCIQLQASLWRMNQRSTDPKLSSLFRHSD